MNALLHKLWEASPRRVAQFLHRRLFPDPVILAQAQPQWVKIPGGPLKGREFFVAPFWQNFAQGIFDAWIYDTLAQEGDWRGRTVWDVGAHFGYHTLGFALTVGPTGKVIAFEPNPANRQRLATQLERNADLAPQVTVRTEVLGRAPGTAEFYMGLNLESGDSSMSRLASAIGADGGTQAKDFSKQTVAVTTMDSMLQEGLPAPQLVKIDVEGAEVDVLRGGANLLRTHRPLLVMEVHHIRLMWELMTWLAPFDYDIRVVESPETTPGRCFVVAKARA